MKFLVLIIFLVGCIDSKIEHTRKIWATCKEMCEGVRKTLKGASFTLEEGLMCDCEEKEPCSTGMDGWQK